MDVTYHTPPGAYVPYLTNCGGFIVAGSPSPPLSLCSEPIFQLPMPDGRCGSPAQQQKTPRMQLLNKTMVDAQKKKIVVRGHNLPSCVEPPDMMNFFNNFVPFPDHFSDSVDGSIQGGPVSPQFRYSNNPYTFSQSQSTPFQYKSVEAPLCYPPPEQKGQVAFLQFEGKNQQTFQQQPDYNWSASHNYWRQTASPESVPLSPTTRNIKQQPERGTSIKISQGTKKESLQSDSKPKRKHVKPKRKPVTSGKKKELITMKNADTLKKERTNRKVLLRKQRKKVQQKNKSLHKTELCTHWMLTSTCTYKGKCYFAHGIDELQKRVRVCNYKTRPCVDCPPKNGKCLFGSRCNYCHPGEAIRRCVESSYVDKDYYRDLRNEFKDNEYPFGIFI